MARAGDVARPTKTQVAAWADELRVVAGASAGTSPGANRGSGPPAETPRAILLVALRVGRIDE
jgi:hypothetical protein